jgi:hypothetical protein
VEECSVDDEAKNVSDMGNIPAAELKESLSNFIADSVIRAALFSTYTFNCDYFEEEILQSLLCGMGQRRGTFPVTVIVDRNRFVGQRSGYDVCLSPGERLWHPKIVALMLENQRQERRTVFAIGSGNLTPSGWRKNLELFLLMEWTGWRLPVAVKHWINPNIGFAQDTKFGRWYIENNDGKADRSVDKTIFGNYVEGCIWDQWCWDRPWNRACIVSPFTDCREEEQNDDPQDYFAKILELASSSSSRLDVYLQVVPDGRVIGSWRTFKWLSERIHLQIYGVEPAASGQRLHAKLHAAKVDGTWCILGGSPNATSAAMVKSEEQSGNVELAWQTKSGTLPYGLLPPGAPVQLKKSNFVEPDKTFEAMRWRVISSVSYNPKNRKLVTEWLPGHSEKDTTILLGEKEIKLYDQVLLGVERAIATLPRSLEEKSKFQADWVPIMFPENESDDPIFERNWTLEEYIAMLTSFEKEDSNGDLTSSATSSHTETMPNIEEDFPWHENVLSLELGLKSVKERLDISISSDETNHLREVVRRCLEKAEPDQDNSDALESSWKKWVRAEICYTILSWDRRKVIYRPFLKLARQWKGKIDPYLRRRMWRDV